MDHWGDPWADNNADEQKSTAKNEVTAPQPLTHAPAPVLLNGFLDDAGWGNEDESFGDWTTSSGIETTPAAAAEIRVNGSSPLANNGDIEDGPRWDAEEHTDPVITDIEEASLEQDQVGLTADNEASETSDASTTVPLDESIENNGIVSTNHLQPDDDSSARPSTSPSETSRNEAPVESPRTSLEEEHGVGKQSRIYASLEDELTIPNQEDTENGTAKLAVSDNGRTDDDEFGTFAEDTQWPEESPDLPEFAQKDDADSTGLSGEPLTASTAVSVEAPPATTKPVVTNSHTIDSALLNELFPPHEDNEDIDDAPDDPIYSMSGRKAWYRLTRKQTMREFNSGNGDDNYIRITWANSQIRSEVNKTVARWAREDRLSGTGPGARASFYWDTPAPAEHNIARGHARTKTTVTTTGAAAPVRQSLPPVTTNTPAAFNWSSPITAADPWKQESPGLRLTSSPIAPKHTDRDGADNEELRAVSLDLTRHAVETRRQTSAAAPETPTVAQGISSPMTFPPASSSDPLGNLDALDTTVQQQSAIAATDDDDDWGEMISSPTVSTPVSAQRNSIAATRDNTLSTLSSTPTTPPTREQSADAMHASSIVRLRSTISPTSALFGPKSFVPLHAEQGPIGPGILKPSKKHVASTPEKSRSEVPSRPHINKSEVQEAPRKERSINASVHEAQISNPTVKSEQEDDGFSAFASNTLPTDLPRPSTPPPHSMQAVEPDVDSWADADFSFFESAPPTTAPVPPQPNPAAQGSSSVFGTPPRPTSAASSAKTFTRSPPRNLTPPPIQPLTGATNAAQRRKNEEEGIIKDILGGLPDLSYMLR